MTVILCDSSTRDRSDADEERPLTVPVRSLASSPQDNGTCDN